MTKPAVDSITQVQTEINIPYEQLKREITGCSIAAYIGHFTKPPAEQGS